ncbi:MAG: flagellar basal body P-ring protein FlgI [Planctomycetes bacterium]|nr:flagellar basal body P-ring protein FlgI [Planctomycetota bacterium]
MHHLHLLCCCLLPGLGLVAQTPAPTLSPTTPDTTTTLAPALAPAAPAADVVLTPPIRAITQLHNSMPHLLTGIGIVVGLDPSGGSSDRGTRQAILNFAREHDLNLAIGDVVGGTTALVSLTASLPPFAKIGHAIDVKIEVICDAKSLRGGTLLRAELRGVDGQAYVAAQGGINASGFSVGNATASVQKNTSTSAHMPNGGLVIREENTSFFSESGALELRLINPSPFNSMNVANGIRGALGVGSARVTAIDPALVRIELPEAERTGENAQRILGLIGNVCVAVENPTKVVIDQASGSVLAGYGVMISPCVVGLSDLTIAVTNEDQISQPNPLSTGTTQRVGRSRVEVQSSSSELKGIDGGSVSDLLQNLRALSLKPEQLVLVFQTLHQGGYLHGQLEIR